NMGHRKRQLEKMTQMTSEELTASADRRESDTNVNDSSDIRSAQPDERSSDPPDTEPLDPA
ncbi:MAG: hypothetical protein WA984_04495, partial [Phormidesmis sp.]